jgi:uncharacterized DUF497 family protein
VFDGIEGFEWDVDNVSHVGRHGVTPFEVEEAMAGRHVVIPARAVQGEERWKLLGRTAGGRYLVFVFTIRVHRIRPITAYTMNRAERTIYGPHID